MPFERHISRVEMSAAIAALEQAAYLHEQWSNAVYASLVCRLPPDERDLADEPHRRCPFGQWYYAQQNTHLSAHAGFVAVSTEHEDLHRRAARLLRLSQAGEPIPVREYDAYVNAMSRLRSEIASLRHELSAALTTRDPLTGAASRLAMLSDLRIQQELVKRDVQPCTIAMMDLDLFKDVNDRYGHQAGDLVLTETVRHVLGRLRPYDELYRYGGEEFLVCTPGSDLATGLAAVERLREEIAGMTVDVGDGTPIRLTASFGVTLLDADVPVEESIARADKALYDAKSAGRNQSCVWRPPAR
jgi:diguanylate cyclase (GGDEF)-like protein